MAERFAFSTLREIFAKANEEKSGDQLAGVAARSERERVAAKYALADIPLRRIIDQPLIDANTDEVTRLIQETWDEAASSPSLLSPLASSVSTCCMTQRTPALSRP